MMRRLLILLVWMLGLPAIASALPSREGWCETGASNVLTAGLTSTTQVQLSVPSCTVQVFIHGGGSAAIFSDATGTALANPFVAQTNGHWQFYAANGHYDVTLSGVGFPNPVTYSDILIFDSTSLFTATPAHTFLGNNTSGSAVPAFVQPGFTDLSGSLACGQTPALTGPITSPAGSCATTAAFLGFNNIFTGNNSFVPGLTTITNLTLGTLNTIRYVDGVTYPTIQSAINALPAGGGTVMIPCGTFTLSSTLTLVSSLVLQGCGIGNTTDGGTRLVASSGAVSPLMQAQGASGASRVLDVFIRDMTIQGVYTAAQLCFLADHTTWIDLTHIQFVQCGQAEFINDSFRVNHYDVEYYKSGSGGTASTATVRVENVSSPGTGATEQTAWINSIWEGDITLSGKQGTAVYVGPNTSQTRITDSKLDYSSANPNFPLIYLNKTNIVDISGNYIAGTNSTSPSPGVIYVTGDNTTRSSVINISNNLNFFFSNAVPAVYLDYATQYNILGNIIGGFGGGTAVVTTANTFGGSVIGNRQASVDALINDVSGLATIFNPDPSLAQWNLRSNLNTNKPIVSTSTISATGGFSTTSTIAATSTITTLGGLIDTSAATRVKRTYSTQGTPLVNGDGVLSGGWGTSPSLTVAGYDPAFAVVVTSGSGSPTANPTVTVTFKDGAWADGNPVCQVSRGDASLPVAGYWIDASTTTQVVLSFIGTPATSTSYTVNVTCGGR